jgi:hypothetical protein
MGVISRGSLGIRSVQDESVVTSSRTPSSRVLPIPSTGPNRSARLKPRGDEPATPLIVGGLGPPGRAGVEGRAYGGGLTPGNLESGNGDVTRSARGDLSAEIARRTVELALNQAWSQT